MSRNDAFTSSEQGDAFARALRATGLSYDAIAGQTCLSKSRVAQLVRASRARS